MNALAVLFRLLSLLSVAGLAAYLWILSETKKTQNNVFLDKQVRNGTQSYSLQKRLNGKIFRQREVLLMKFLTITNPLA